jgi:hypothetical protein
MALLDAIDVNILTIVLSIVVCKKKDIEIAKLNNILSITKGYWK